MMVTDYDCFKWGNFPLYYYEYRILRYVMIVVNDCLIGIGTIAKISIEFRVRFFRDDLWKP